MEQVPRATQTNYKEVDRGQHRLVAPLEMHFSVAFFFLCNDGTFPEFFRDVLHCTAYAVLELFQDCGEREGRGGSDRDDDDGDGGGTSANPNISQRIRLGSRSCLFLSL